MTTEIAQIAENQKAYGRADVVEYFQGFGELFETEKVLFEKITPKIRKAKLLDIGIGGGRTTKYLLDMSSDYTGVDYVKQFVDDAAKKFPDANILWADAKDLTTFEDRSFDFVLFSFNGLDCISHEDRLQALREINRVLKTDGIFMFSSHNRDYKHFNKLPWQQKIQFNPTYLKYFLYCLYHLPTHLRMKKYEIFSDEYALVNDGDHRFSMLLYYISIDKQIAQLNANGFVNVEAYNVKGEMVDSDRTSHWIYYLGTKK